ncbi:ArpU family phage packaging/lysis transcriptional regulator [Macrococcus capreoli]|uniref:ArpU family phage packaging/lysis transcriptional regulator n=1 Tax=Macrococcus capreoli TaxID=2982690 RepID=UPI003EE66643
MTSLLTEMKNLDFIKTRRNVYRIFKRYNKLLNLLPLRSMPSVTQSFSFIPPSTVSGLNKIEVSADKNIKREQMMQERETLLNRVHEAVDNLKPDEKYIIVNKYLQDERGIDFEIYTDLGIGKTKYYEIKNDAIIRLAFYLGIDEYMEDDAE